MACKSSKVAQASKVRFVSNVVELGDQDVWHKKHKESKLSTNRARQGTATGDSYLACPVAGRPQYCL